MDEKNDAEMETSAKAVTEISERLSRLRNIPDCEKTEAGMLKSRINEQSQLIMILKKRADENLIRCQAMEKINKDLEEFRDSAKEDLETEYRRYAMLEQRFQELADNHEQMIRFKDQYKRQNEQLRRENERLMEENKALFNSKIQEQERRIADLSKGLAELRQSSRALEQEKGRLEAELAETRAAQAREADAARAALAAAEERLRTSQAALAAAEASRDNAAASGDARTAALEKEKEELLDLVMQRGRLVQEKQNEILALNKRVKAAEEKTRKMEQKFQLDAEAVNVNATVARLRHELEQWQGRHHDLAMEFDAYKTHTTKLLDSERELNQRLRNTIR